MPYTAKQRRFFHAAAERGEKGMTKLSHEADRLAKSGEERPPIHEAHGGMCYACGGKVDAMGMAEGGEVPDPLDIDEFGAEEEEGPEEVNEWGKTSQQAMDDELDARARRNFIRAVRSR